MHSAVRKSGIQDPDRYRRLILEPLNTVAQFGASASIRDGCASVLNRVSMDWLKALPAIPQHGDLFPSNILTHRREWYVVDWESFGMVNLPFYDLLTLLLSLLQTEAETPDKWHPSLTKQAPLLIGDYARQLGLRADIPLLLPLTLANWFHLQWVDGRKEFVTRMYRTIEHYFDHRELWESVFVSRVE
jgi:thiamine kinase-like enzyme